MNPYSRVIAVGHGALLLLCSMPNGARAQSTPSQPGSTTRSVRLDIAADRATYRAGDPVSVRLQVLNTAGVPITFLRYPPWAEVRLTVTDGTGRIVPRAKSPAPIYMVSARKVTLPAGATRVSTWNNQEWFSLRMWGYVLPGPGRYTIVGAPDLSIVGASLDTTSRSNPVTITVTP
jgi:hypothetical protein